jgi:hypothetical protein
MKNKRVLITARAGYGMSKTSHRRSRLAQVASR